MPTEEKSKTETSQMNNKFFAGVVILFAFLGLAGGYTIFPLLQSPNVVTLTSNLTNNNTTSYDANPVVKHSTKYTNSSSQSNQNNTDNSNSKTSSKSNTSNSAKKVVQTNKNNSS